MLLNNNLQQLQSYTAAVQTTKKWCGIEKWVLTNFQSWLFTNEECSRRLSGGRTKGIFHYLNVNLTGDFSRCLLTLYLGAGRKNSRKYLDQHSGHFPRIQSLRKSSGRCLDSSACLRHYSFDAELEQAEKENTVCEHCIIILFFKSPSIILHIRNFDFTFTSVS